MPTFTVSSGSWASLKPLLPFIIPLAIIEFGLMVAALIHVFTHKTYKMGNRWIWVAVVIVANSMGIGSVLYFILGRSDKSKVENDTSSLSGIETPPAPVAAATSAAAVSAAAATPDNQSVLSIQHLAKSFGSATPVLRDVSLDVPEGSVYGFIGANGAGKTTTMKIVLGLLRADAGEVQLAGEQVRFGMTATNRQVGYLPDVPEFYNYLRPHEYLRLCGRVVGLDEATIAVRSAELLDLVGLHGDKKKIGGFSRGMKQRLGVAQALINEPRLLICDEPTSALDPLGRKETLGLLRQISSKTTVVFSTHVLSDVERICDRVAVLAGGTIALEGTLAELKARHQADGLQIEFTGTADLERFCAQVPEQILQKSERNGAELTLHVRDLASAQRAALQLLSAIDILPVRFELLEPDIEDLFLEAVA